MRKLFVSNLVSVDGMFAGSGGNIDWHVFDDELNKHAIGMMNTVDTMILGGKTFGLFEDFWPAAGKDPATDPDDLVIARLMDEYTKIVFSKSRHETNWQNTKIHHNIDPAEIRELKNQPGKDIVIFGSGTIVQAMTNLGLIDEYQLIINPVILGQGKPLFEGINHKLDLNLTSSKTFSSGNVLLCYQPTK